MEIQGKVLELLAEATGEGRNGVWRKQEFILETQDQFPKKVCIALWGERIDQYNLQVGDQITASVNIESREFNSRWYTDVKAWKIDKTGSGNTPLPGNEQDPGPTEMPQDNDLPF